jgi:hypothetical protein
VLNDPTLLDMLARQYGVVATSQLISLGVPARSIHYFRQRGVVDEVLPGVVHAKSHPVTFESRALAVQLALPGAVLSGATAGRLLGLRNMPSSTIYTLVAGRSRTSVPDWVRRSSSSRLDLDADIVIVHDVFRVLRAEPMLLSLAEVFTDFRFERAAEDAWHLRLTSPQRAAAFLGNARGRGRRGVRRFERWLERTSARTRPSGSGFELDVLDALRKSGLPEPCRQHPLTLATG